MLRSIFLFQLLQFSINSADDLELTPQRARWRNLPATSHGILEAFVQQRLLISDGEGDERTLKIAHQSLLKNWQTLLQWVQDESEVIRFRHAFNVLFARWERAADGEKSDCLLRDTMLRQALDAQTKPAVNLTRAEKNFIEVSRAGPDFVNWYRSFAADAHQFLSGHSKRILIGYKLETANRWRSSAPNCFDDASLRYLEVCNTNFDRIRFWYENFRLNYTPDLPQRVVLTARLLGRASTGFFGKTVGPLVLGAAILLPLLGVTSLFLYVAFLLVTYSIGAPALSEAALREGIVFKDGESALFRTSSGNVVGIFKKGDIYRKIEFDAITKAKELILCADGTRAYVPTTGDPPKLHVFDIGNANHRTIELNHAFGMSLVWSMRCDEAPDTLMGAAVFSLTFWSDGLFDTMTSEVSFFRDEHDQPVRLLGMLPNGDVLTLRKTDHPMSETSSLIVFEHRTRRPKRSFPLGVKSSSRFAFYSASLLLVDSPQSEQEGVVTWQLRDGTLREGIRVSGPLGYWDVNKSGTRLATLDRRGRLSVFDLERGVLLAARDGFVDVIDMSLSGAGTKVLLKLKGIKAEIVDITRGFERRPLHIEMRAFDQFLNNYLTIPYGDLVLVTGSSGNRVIAQFNKRRPTLWNSRPELLQQQLGAEEDIVAYVGLSPDERYAFTTTNDGAIHIYDASRGGLIWSSKSGSR